jgi:hypothetical protein
VKKVFGRIALVLMLLVSASVAWLGYSISAGFENWPWTVRDTYRSGNFEGIIVGSTKASTVQQIFAGQKQGALDRIVFMEDAGMLDAQENPGSPLTGNAVQRMGHADHWHLAFPGCRADGTRPICSIELYFSQDRLVRIVHERYFGPEGT